MPVRKSDLVRDALSRLGIIGYDYDIDPEEFRTGLIILESMMASWDGRGLRVSYALARTPESAQGEDDAGIPDIARKAVVSHLAIELSDTYGKTVTQSLAASAGAAMSDLLSAIQYIPTSQYPARMPRGSGNSRYGSRMKFYGYSAPTLNADNSGPIDTGDEGAITL